MSTIRKPQSPRFSQKRRSRRKHHQHMVRSQLRKAHLRKGVSRPVNQTKLKDFIITDDKIVINLYAQRLVLK